MANNPPTGTVPSGDPAAAAPPVAPPAPAAAPPAAAPAAAAPSAAPAAAPAAPAAGAKPPEEGDPQWLNKRIEQAKKNGGSEATKQLLKELGVDNLEDAKKKIDAATALENEKKTDKQRADEKIAKLEPEAKRASELAAIIAEDAAEQMAALTDAQRETVKSFAGDDPAAQVKTIKSLRKGGMLPAASAAAPAAPAGTTPAGAPGTAPGTTPAAPPAPAGKPPVAAPASTTNAGTAPPPADATNVDHKAVYASLQTTNPMAAAQYAERYHTDIYKTG